MTQASGEDAPDLSLPGWKVQELASLVWISVGAMQRYRHRQASRDRAGADQAARDARAGQDALRTATGDDTAAGGDVPRPLDPQRYEQAREMASRQQDRWAEATPLYAVGQDRWAVVGEIPGVGRVGCEVATQQQAEATRQLLLTAPSDQLGEFAVTQEQPAFASRHTREHSLHQAREQYADLVGELDPNNQRHQALARNLLGQHSSAVNSAVLNTFGEQVRTAPEATEDFAAGARGSSAPAASTALTAAVQQLPPSAQSVESIAPAAVGNGAPQQGEAAAMPMAQVPPAVAERLGDGTHRIDVQQAAQYYPNPTQLTAPVLEVRTPDGVREPTNDELIASTIPSLDPGSEQDRATAVSLWGQRGRQVDDALAQRYPGLRQAMDHHGATPSGEASSTDAHAAQVEQASSPQESPRKKAAATASVATQQPATASQDAQGENGTTKKSTPAPQKQKSKPPQQPTQQPSTRSRGQ